MGINVQDKREAQITDIDILCECRRETRRPPVLLYQLRESSPKASLSYSLILEPSKP